MLLLDPGKSVNHNGKQRIGWTVEACPICSSDSVLRCMAQDHHYGNIGEWKLYKCTHCNHMFQYPFPTEEELSGFYPESYYAHQRPHTDLTPRGLRHRRAWLKLHYLKYCRGYEHLPVWKNPVLAFIGSFLDVRPLSIGAPRFVPDGLLLDYGSGSGDSVAFMQFTGWRAEGIELNAKAAQVGKESGLTVFHGSIERLEVFRSRYDYILSSHCVEHVVDVARLFRAMFDALKPGGMLAIDIPNSAAAAIERYREFAFYLGLPVHTHLFSPTSIRRLAEQAGFVNVTIATYSRWSTQVKAALLWLRAQRGETPQLSFQSPRGWEGVRAAMISLPTYLRSKTHFRGDCLVMTCLKPTM